MRLLFYISLCLCSFLLYSDGVRDEVREMLEKMDLQIEVVSPEKSKKLWSYKMMMLKALGEYKLALRECRKLLKKNPNDGYFHYCMSTIYQSRGKQDRAEKMIDRALEREPDNFAFLNQKAGLYLFEEGKAEEALSLYEQLAERDLPAVQHNLAVAHFFCGNEAKALNLLSDLIERREKRGEEIRHGTYYQRAVIFEKMGKREEAVRDLKDCLAIAYHPDAHLLLLKAEAEELMKCGK